MAKGKNKHKGKDEQVMDGLGVSFEDAMNIFAKPLEKPKSALAIRMEKVFSSTLPVRAKMLDVKSLNNEMKETPVIQLKK